MKIDRDFAKYVGYGVAMVLIGIVVILYVNRGAHVVLDGSIQKVRVQAMDDKSCVVVADFRFINPSDYPFIVRKVEIFMVGADGNRLQGSTIGEVDAKRLFEYYKVLGPKYNESLIMRDRVEAKESLDRMVCARFEVPEVTATSRQSVIIRVEDVDGAVSDIVEQRGS